MVCYYKSINYENVRNYAYGLRNLGNLHKLSAKYKPIKWHRLITQFNDNDKLRFVMFYCIPLMCISQSDMVFALTIQNLWNNGVIVPFVWWHLIIMVDFYAEGGELIASCYCMKAFFYGFISPWSYQLTITISPCVWLKL